MVFEHAQEPGKPGAVHFVRSGVSMETGAGSNVARTPRSPVATWYDTALRVDHQRAITIKSTSCEIGAVQDA